MSASPRPCRRGDPGAERWTLTAGLTVSLLHPHPVAKPVVNGCGLRHRVSTGLQVGRSPSGFEGGGTPARECLMGGLGKLGGPLNYD